MTPEEKENALRAQARRCAEEITKAMSVKPKPKWNAVCPPHPSQALREGKADGCQPGEICQCYWPHERAVWSGIMKERGMIFNAEMVRAILDGRKTQTRRIMAPQPADDIERCIFPNPEAIGWKSSLRHKHGSTTAHFCHYGKPGDRIWVRETWNKYGGLLTYRADHDWIDDMRKETVCTAKWVPSIHMPRWASRILLEITDVRVERVNAISPEDAESEGLERTNFTGFGDEPGLPSYPEPDVYFDPLKKQWKEYPPEAFAGLWESIYGEGSWQANPWVWVIEFKRVEGGAA